MTLEGMLHLTTVFGIPVIVLGLSKTRILPVKSNIVLAIISFLILYAFIVGSAKLDEYQIEQELYRVDLDGDGGLTENELTPGAKSALDRFSNDTGRSLAPLSGLIFSFIYVATLYMIVHIARRHRKK